MSSLADTRLNHREIGDTSSPVSRMEIRTRTRWTHFHRHWTSVQLAGASAGTSLRESSSRKSLDFSVSVHRKPPRTTPYHARTLHTRRYVHDCLQRWRLRSRAARAFTFLTIDSMRCPAAERMDFRGAEEDHQDWRICFFPRTSRSTNANGIRTAQLAHLLRRNWRVDGFCW